jgi:hypothetical protein
MTYRANVYRVMLASPSDVKEERIEFSRVLETWNALHSLHERAVILPVKWETHSTPEMGDRPQEIINNQLIRDSDILVGVFWTRLGTPTGKAASGSVEEVEEFCQQGKPVLLYFSSAPVVADSINIKQYETLKEFREKCFQEGLVSTYNSVEEFRDLLSRHLLDTVRRLQGKKAATSVPTREIPDVGTQDRGSRVKVDVQHSITFSSDELEQYKLRVDLSNLGIRKISNYHLDIEFPRSFVNPATIYALERVERSNDKYKFFRVTQEHHRNEPLYPNDNRTVFVIDYKVDGNMFTNGALDQHLTLRVYVDDQEVAIIDKPMRDLVNEGWKY